jgi:hypothetical protein
MRSVQVMLAISVAVLVTSLFWAFSPSKADTAKASFEPTEPATGAPAGAGDEHALLPEFPGMELWTKPPPVMTPPPPPPALRLNAELLAVRNGESDSDVVATLYLVDRGEIIRLKQGDELDGMTVEHVSESSIRFARGERTLTIKRQAD